MVCSSRNAFGEVLDRGTAARTLLLCALMSWAWSSPLSLNAATPPTAEVDFGSLASMNAVKSTINARQWSKLDALIAKLGDQYAALPPGVAAERAESVLQIAEVLVKCGKIDQGLRLISFIDKRAAVLPKKQAIGNRFLDIGEVLIALGEGSRAIPLLDSGCSLISSAETWGDEKASAVRRRNRLLHDLTRGEEQKSFNQRQQQMLKRVPMRTGPAFRPGVRMPVEALGQTQLTLGDQNEYRFDYVALASNSAYFGGNTSLRAQLPDEPFESLSEGSFAGAFGRCVADRFKVAQTNGFSWVFGQPFVDVQRIESVYGGSIPPVVQPLPFKPALKAPASAIRLPEGEQRAIELTPGDYTVRRLVTSYRIRGEGRVRIFIEGDVLTEGPVFICDGLEDMPEDAKLEIWYNGEGTLRFEHNSQFRGIVYAPNARIELGRNNSMFVGAMVARDIFADGNVRLIFDESLLRWRAH